QQHDDEDGTADAQGVVHRQEGVDGLARVVDLFYSGLLLQPEADRAGERRVQLPYQQGVGPRVLDEGGVTGEDREVRVQVGKRLFRADVLESLNLGHRPRRGYELLVVCVGTTVHGPLWFALEVGENLAEVGTGASQCSELGEGKRHAGDG